MFQEQPQTQAMENVGYMKALSIIQLVCGGLAIVFLVRKSLFSDKLSSSTNQNKHQKLKKKTFYIPEFLFGFEFV